MIPLVESYTRLILVKTIRSIRLIIPIIQTIRKIRKSLEISYLKSEIIVVNLKFLPNKIQIHDLK